MNHYSILAAVGPGFIVIVNGRWCLGHFSTRYAARKAAMVHKNSQTDYGHTRPIGVDPDIFFANTENS